MVSSSPSAVAIPTARAPSPRSSAASVTLRTKGCSRTTPWTWSTWPRIIRPTCEWAVRAADAGKHVLCEKPLAVRHADAVRIVEAARRNDVFLLEAFAYRCSSADPTTGRAAPGRGDRAGASDRRRPSDTTPARRPRTTSGTATSPGGSILDVGCYTTSMAHMIAAASAGVPVLPTIDVAAAGVFGPTGVDLSTAATLTFDGGVLARVACSIQANLDRSVRIIGSSGRIELPSPWLPGLIDGDARILLATIGR